MAAVHPPLLLAKIHMLYKYASPGVRHELENVLWQNSDIQVQQCLSAL